MGALTGRRILLVAEYYESGGTRTYIHQLLEFYNREGAHVTLVSTFEGSDPEFQGLLGESRFDFFSYQQVMSLSGQDHEGRPNVWSWLRWRQERRAFRRFAEDGNFDTVVVSAGTPGMLLGSLWAVDRAIYILHTYPHGRRQELLGRHYLSRMIPRESQIIAVSEFERDLVNKLWRPGRRNVRVTTVFSTYGDLAINRSSGLGPNTVLTVSLVEAYKRPIDWVKLAVDVSERLPRQVVRFRWFGDGSLLDEARVAAASVYSKADVTFEGVTSNPEPEYENCRIYLQYSSIENMSLAVIDALRHGIPCIVTRVGGLPEIIQDGVNGFVVDLSDQSAAAIAIDRLLTDPQLWDKLSAGAHRAYLERHSLKGWRSSMVAAHG